jgi:hypothetical protein
VLEQDLRKVKIIRCSVRGWWYQTKIGQEVILDFNRPKSNGSLKGYHVAESVTMNGHLAAIYWMADKDFVLLDSMNEDCLSLLPSINSYGSDSDE